MNTISPDFEYLEKKYNLQYSMFIAKETEIHLLDILIFFSHQSEEQSLHQFTQRPLVNRLRISRFIRLENKMGTKS